MSLHGSSPQLPARLRLSAALTAALLGVCGCSADDDAQSGGLSDAAVAEFVGTYAVTAYTVNDAGCEAQGPSVLDSLTDTRFVLADQVVLGRRLLQLASCKDDADCSSKWTAIRGNQGYALEYGFAFTARESDDTLTGFTASAGPAEQDGSCHRTYSVHVLSLREDGSLRLESRLKRLADQPQRDGVCWLEPAAMKREAEDRPCATLTVIHATPVP